MKVLRIEQELGFVLMEYSKNTKVRKLKLEYILGEHLAKHARAFPRDAHMSTIIWNVGREIRDLGEKRDKGDPFLASGSRFGTQEPIIFLGCPLTLLVSSRKTEYITLLQYSLIVPCSRFIEQSVTFC